jgi:hypothetical protein
MPVTPLLIHKIHDNNNGVDAGDGFSDLQSDIIAKVIVELRAEWRADIQAAIAAAVAELHNEADMTEAVAELRGQVSVLVSLVGNSDSNGSGQNRSRKAKSVQTSEQTIRRLTVTDRS